MILLKFHIIICLKQEVKREYYGKKKRLVILLKSLIYSVIVYDGRIIDVGIKGLGIGMTYMFKDGVFKFKVNALVLGFSMSIDFVELFKMLFGGK